MAKEPITQACKINILKVVCTFITDIYVFFSADLKNEIHFILSRQVISQIGYFFGEKLNLTLFCTFFLNVLNFNK